MALITNACTVQLIDSMGDDCTVVNAARVSFAKHIDEMSEADERLLSYLAKHQHWTPFAHVMITLRIKMPVFVARQWFRHTIGVARNEVSRRYVDDAPEYFLPDVLRARPDGSIKQGSGGAHHDSDFWREMMEKAFCALDGFYATLIEAGVAPEQARIVLPVAHMTEFYETGSLAYFARVAKLRADAHAQGEIQDCMSLVAEAIAPAAPKAWAALTR